MEITELCKSCLGCNRLADETFTGVNECKNNENGLEQCKKIIEQMKMEELDEV